MEMRSISTASRSSMSGCTDASRSSIGTWNARGIGRAHSRAEFGSHEVRKLERDEQAILDRVAEISGLLILVPLRHAR